MLARSILGITWLALTAIACYPDRSVDSTTEFASVTTLFDKEADFETVTRYALPDTVLYVPALEDEVPAATQAAILTSIRQNLNQLGWTEVLNPRTNPVDVYVVATVTSQTSTYWVYWWDYWGWYPYWPVGWTGASASWYYPGYWYPYSYTTGTVLIGMADARPTVTDGRIPLMWSAGVNGVLADQGTNVSIATAAIDQAFEQSPYLTGGTR
jgi:Domain of unknown function (DUF4136)